VKAPWNPDDDIATLWTRIKDAQDFARGTSFAITDDATIILALEAIEAAGVMAPYINEWRRKEYHLQTLANFKAHFTTANKVRLEELTAKQAGVHAASAARPATPTKGKPLQDLGGARADKLITLHYCWTHGLGRSSDHTSKTCKTPAPGHHYDATILDMKGGCRLVVTLDSKSRREASRQARQTRREQASQSTN